MLSGVRVLNTAARPQGRSREDIAYKRAREDPPFLGPFRIRCSAVEWSGVVGRASGLIW